LDLPIQFAGLVIPCIERLWAPWWEAETRGRAIAILKYCSGLIYFEGENKPFGIQCLNRGRYGPFLWECDSSISFGGWLESNITFLRGVLSFDYVFEKIAAASNRLLNEPEHELAQMMLADAVSNREIVESRIAELPLLLSNAEPKYLDGWSI
jgi:hypothetical protein